MKPRDYFLLTAKGYVLLCNATIDKDAIAYRLYLEKAREQLELYKFWFDIEETQEIEYEYAA